MTKKRPVMVISPRLLNRSEIVTIVPLSTTPPRSPALYAVLLSKDYSPLETTAKQVWAKCDMVLNVSRQRLTSYKIGRRKYLTPEATGDDLSALADF